MIKGAPVKTEARTLPGASATTEVQNNILLAASDPADASVVLLCRSSCMILLPLELCVGGVREDDDGGSAIVQGILPQFWVTQRRA